MLISELESTATARHCTSLHVSDLLVRWVGEDIFGERARQANIAQKKKEAKKKEKLKKEKKKRAEERSRKAQQATLNSKETSAYQLIEYPS
jgi:hypothetical protein